MFRGLVLKELREIWWLGLLPLAVMIHVTFREAGRDLLSGAVRDLNYWQTMPFADSQVAYSALQCGCLLAAALGLWQTFRESQGHTWHFLLHRPANRQAILGAKLAAAAAVYLLSVVMPPLCLALWAATAGTHPSPFAWSLTDTTWYAAAAGTTLYLAGMFAGLRRGRLYGSRMWPLLGAGVLFGIGSVVIPYSCLTWMWMVLLLWDLLLAFAVRDELLAADFN